MNKMKLLLASTAMLAGACAAVSANAAIPTYGSPGVVNGASYSFTATATGDVIAYFAGSDAGYDSLLGLTVNGVDLGARVFPNHSTALGATYNFGTVTAGDALVFLLEIVAPPSGIGTYYSKESLNPGGLQHVYSTGYAGGDFGIPAGVYIGFEDILDLGDIDYNDHQFVFTNVGGLVPEPGTWAMMIAGFGLVGAAMRRRQKVAVTYA